LPSTKALISINLYNATVISQQDVTFKWDNEMKKKPEPSNLTSMVSITGCP